MCASTDTFKHTYTDTHTDQTNTNTQYAHTDTYKDTDTKSYFILEFTCVHMFTLSIFICE